VLLGDAILLQSEEITPTEIVFQFERYDLYNIYITVRDRGECKPSWNPNGPRGK